MSKPAILYKEELFRNYVDVEDEDRENMFTVNAKDSKTG